MIGNKNTTLKRIHAYIILKGHREIKNDIDRYKIKKNSEEITKTRENMTKNSHSRTYVGG
jgi:hypothetical protein